MREVLGPDPRWPFVVCKFEGCGNAEWLLKLPIHLGPIKETTLILNHPWTGDEVELLLSGYHHKRKEVMIFKQKELPKRKIPSPFNFEFSGGFNGFHD